MKGEMSSRVVYDSPMFRRKIKETYDMEEIIKPKGRPKKDEEEK